MKRIFQLVADIDTVDQKLLDKLIYLDRLVRLYCRFLKYWRVAIVTTNGKVIKVRFTRTNVHGYESFTEREFPIDDLDKRILSYKRKVAKEFAARHENKRIERENEIHKWKRYIEGRLEDAEV